MPDEYDAPIHLDDLTFKARVIAGLARLDAKVETGVAKTEAKMETGFARLDAKIETSLARIEAKTESSLSKLDAKMNLLTGADGAEGRVPNLEKEVKSLNKKVWMFSGAVVGIGGILNYIVDFFNKR